MCRIALLVLLVAGCRFDAGGLRPREADQRSDDLAASDLARDRPRDREREPPLTDAPSLPDAPSPPDQAQADHPALDTTPKPDTKPKPDLPKPDTKPKPDLPKPDTKPPLKTCTQIYGTAMRFRLCKEFPARCEFFVNTYSSVHTCQTICANHGGTCITAYDAAGYSSSTDQCSYSTQWNCADSYWYHICVCSRF